MKIAKCISIVISIMLSGYLDAQDIGSALASTDPFCQMVLKIYSENSLCFDSRLNVKQLFTEDTVRSTAGITLRKNGNTIKFLRIIPAEGEMELLYCNDTSWLVNHQEEKLICLGTSVNELENNYIANYFPFSLYKIDTLIIHARPFWRVLHENNGMTDIAIDMTDYPKELTDVKVEFSVRNSDYLPARALQESVYLNADKMIQEQLFYNYSTPDPKALQEPEYCRIYGKDFSILNYKEADNEQSASKSDSAVFLNDLELVTLEGKPKELPDDGLLFIDLWYFGCAPCLRSAPVIEKLYGKFGDKVWFFSINEVDRDTSRIISFREKMNISFPVLLNNKSKISLLLDTGGGYPVFLLVDGATRKVLWSMTGYSENLEEMITEKIYKYL